MPQANAGTIWATIDRLANDKGWSLSHLAKLAGMDATAFNKSKRIDPNGRKRMPNTETIINTAAALGMTTTEFFSVVEDGLKGSLKLPIISTEQAEDDSNWADNGWLGRYSFPRMSFPTMTGSIHWAMRLTTDDYEPVYRKNSILIFSPEQEPRADDHVGIKVGGDYLLGRFVMFYSGRVRVSNLIDSEEVDLPIRTTEFVHRISWSSQG